jgi:cysteine desulfurase / selenocysteine lyase
MKNKSGSSALTSATLDAVVKDEFPVNATCIYLNHAAVAPWPQRTRDAVTRFADESAREGARHYGNWIQTEKAVRMQVARLINGPSTDDIALLKNTSEALSVVAHGFPWHAGDNVLISNEEFPSNRIVWESLRDRGVSVREVRLHGEVDPEQALLAAIDSRTRMLSISSVQYASGRRMDLARLGDACHTRGVAFCVDAIQGLGVVAHDVEAMHIDFLMADAHKWLLGPEGIALFYCRPQWREQLTLFQYGWHMIEDAGNYDRRDWMPARSARRFECGSPNMLGIHALHASLSLLLEVGIDTIERQTLHRTRYLLDAIGARSTLELLTPSTTGRYAGIVTFRPRTIESQVLWQYLTERNVVCAVRGGGIRFSPHFYIGEALLEESLKLVDACISA